MNFTVYRTIFVKAIWCVFHLFGQKLFQSISGQLVGVVPCHPLSPLFTRISAYVENKQRFLVSTRIKHL